MTPAPPLIRRKREQPATIASVDRRVAVDGEVGLDGLADDLRARAAFARAPGIELAQQRVGQVISNLGGSPSQVVCPCCEGGGMQISGHDAQAARSAADR